MNDEQYLLANAYLDGELTDDERRIAEADPAVMAEVESLRALQAELREVPAPNPSVREAAIGAAMAEFARRDVTPAHSAADTRTPDTNTPPPVPIRPRPDYSRILSIAAAIVTIGVLGVVVTQGIGGGDDDDAAEPAEMVADVATAEDSARASAPALATIAPADGDDAGGTDDMADDMAGDMAATEAIEAVEDTSADAADEPEAALDEAADSEAEDGGGELAPRDPAYDLADSGDVVRPDVDVEAPITNDLELGAFGAYLIERRDGGLLPPTPNTDCPPRLQILDAATAVIDGVERDVYIAVQEADEIVIAVDRDTCAELVDGPLFPPFGG